MHGEKAEGGREKCAWKKTVLVFRCGGRGWTEGGIDLREVCARENIFTKFRNDTAQLMESVRARGGGKSNVDETREKKIPMERGQGTREQVNGCKKQVLRQSAADCSKLQQIAASCRRLQQAVTSCRRL